MGLPMIQVFMIAARQISKPVSDAVLRYGKDHPVFRSKILIPIGRGIVHLTARLRMKRLGLGELYKAPLVSETAALEQASEFVQQLVLFTYSLGVFWGYYMYTKSNTPETVKVQDFEDFQAEYDETVAELRQRIELLETVLRNHRVKIPAYVPPSSLDQKSNKESTEQVGHQEPETTEQAKSRFPRISSLPVDSAANIVLNGDASNSI